MATFELRDARMPLEKMQLFQESLRSLDCNATISAAHMEFVNGLVDIRKFRVNYDDSRGTEALIERAASRYGLSRQQQQAHALGVLKSRASGHRS